MPRCSAIPLGAWPIALAPLSRVRFQTLNLAFQQVAEVTREVHPNSRPHIAHDGVLIELVRNGTQMRPKNVFGQRTFPMVQKYSLSLIQNFHGQTDSDVPFICGQLI